MAFICNDGIQEGMDRNDAFKDFIGQCISHFMASYTLNTEDCEVEKYQVPDDMEDTFTNEVYLIKQSGSDDVYISDGEL